MTQPPQENPLPLPLNFLSLTGKLSREIKVSPDGLLSIVFRNIRRIKSITTSKEGKYTVMGIDKFDGDDWVDTQVDAAEEALRIARKKTDDAKNNATSYDVATVYYAYDPQGKYLGGDTWKGE